MSVVASGRRSARNRVLSFGQEEKSFRYSLSFKGKPAGSIGFHQRRNKTWQATVFGPSKSALRYDFGAKLKNISRSTGNVLIGKVVAPTQLNLIRKVRSLVHKHFGESLVFARK